jgi:hypothetical protein
MLATSSSGENVSLLLAELMTSILPFAAACKPYGK